MESAFTSFEANIRYAQERNALTEPVVLILLGRMLHAVDRGDLTPAEMRKLEAMLGHPRQRFSEAFEVAAYEMA